MSVDTVFLLKGNPGSGKTRCIVEILCNLYIHENKYKMLVANKSGNALNLLAEMCKNNFDCDFLLVNRIECESLKTNNLYYILNQDLEFKSKIELFSPILLKFEHSNRDSSFDKV